MTLPRLTDIEQRAQNATTRTVAGFPGYEVDSEGRVYSMLNWRGYGRREISPTKTSGGYEKVRLRSIDGRRVNRTVHRVVALSFFGERPEGAQIRHLNGDKTDNRLANLAWGTAAENAADRNEHGTTARGSRNGFALLKESDIPVIRELAQQGVSQKKIGKQFGVSQSAISRVVKGRGWTHV